MAQSIARAAAIKPRAGCETPPAAHVSQSCLRSIKGGQTGQVFAVW